jgi:hypothetical protein
MINRIRVKPGRAMSAIAVVAGIGMLIFGVTTFGANAGSFKMLWVGVIVAIILYHLANVLGLPVSGIYTIEAEMPARVVEQPDVATALRTLDALHAEGIINDAEYAAKRAEIMQRRWS